MNLNWSNRVIKYVLFVFNLLFVISGIILIAVGVSVKTYYTDYDIFLDNRYFSLPNLLIAIGSLIFFISFFGCCGAIRESWFMIFIFSILLTLIFIMEFSAGIAGYVLRDQTRDFIEDSLTKTLKDYESNKPSPNPTTIMWDNMQEAFSCCGVSGPQDWLKKVPVTTVTSTSSTTDNSSSGAETSSTVTTGVTPPSTTPTTPTIPTGSNKTKRSIRSPSSLVGDDPDTYLPASCCTSKHGATGNLICQINSTSMNVYKEGCVDGFGDFLKAHAVTLGGVGLAIAFIQLFGIIFACHLTKQLKNGFYST